MKSIERQLKEAKLANYKFLLEFKLETTWEIVFFCRQLIELVKVHPEWGFWELFEKGTLPPLETGQKFVEGDYANIFEMFIEIKTKADIPKDLIYLHSIIENMLWTIYWLEEIPMGLPLADTIYASHDLGTLTLMQYGRVHDWKPSHKYLGVRKIVSHAFPDEGVEAVAPPEDDLNFEPDRYLEDRIAQLESELKTLK
jgi:hypothetical protein